MIEENNADINKRFENLGVIQYKELFPPFPRKNLLIEVTNACNLECIFCANRKMTRKKGIISPNLTERVLNEAYENGTREVGFYSTGEPLLCNDIANYVKLAKRIGYEYVYITTNGVVATADRIRQLVSYGLDSLKFSINAIDRDTYKFIHGRDCYDAVMQNLREANRLRENEGYDFKLYVSYIMTRYSYEDSKRIKEHFAGLCDSVIILNSINQSGLTPENDDLLRVIDNDENFSINVKLQTPCSQLFTAINVTKEGYLTACCADFQNYLVYADLNNTTMAEAWHNDVIVGFRKRHLEGSVCGTICDNCINTVSYTHLRAHET